MGPGRNSPQPPVGSAADESWNWHWKQSRRLRNTALVALGVALGAALVVGYVVVRGRDRPSPDLSELPPLVQTPPVDEGTGGTSPTTLSDLAPVSVPPVEPVVTPAIEGIPGVTAQTVVPAAQAPSPTASTAPPITASPPYTGGPRPTYSTTTPTAATSTSSSTTLSTATTRKPTKA